MLSWLCGQLCFQQLLPHEEQAGDVGLVSGGVAAADPDVEGGGEEGKHGLVEQAAHEVDWGAVVVARAVLEHDPKAHPQWRHRP